MFEKQADYKAGAPIRASPDSGTKNEMNAILQSAKTSFLYKAAFINCFIVSLVTFMLISRRAGGEGMDPIPRGCVLTYFGFNTAGVMSHQNL